MSRRKTFFYILLSLYSLLLFCACGRQETEDLGEEYQEGMDYQAGLGQQSMPQIQKVGDGYYFLVSDRLYYYAPPMEQAIPVCGKADCDHTGEDCHAYMGSFVDEINYYDHKIYYIAEDRDEIENVGRYFLWFVSEDGSRREKVAQIATVEEDSGGVGFQLCVHRGYAYFVVDINRGVDKKTKTAVQKINLEGAPVCSEVAVYEGYCPGIKDLTAYGNTLVVSGSSADTPYGDAPVHTDFFDIRDGSRRQDVLYDPAPNFEWSINFLRKRGNEVVYQDSNSRKLFSLDLGSGETKALAQYGTVHVCSALEGEYFYTCNWTECREKNNFEDYGIEVFGADGNKVAAIPMEEEMSWEYGDGSYLFAIGFHEGDRTVFIIDKEQMLKGETEWKPVLTVSGEDADDVESLEDVDNEGDEDHVKNEDDAKNAGDAESSEDADNEGDAGSTELADDAGNEGDAYEDGSEKDFME